MDKTIKLEFEPIYNLQIRGLHDWPWNFHRCKLCSYATRFLHNLHSHMRQHMTRSKNHRFTCDLNSPDKYKCQECNFQSDFKIFLTEHFDRVHRRIREIQHYPTVVFRCCENCDFETLSSLVLLSHVKSCDGRGVSTKDTNLIELEDGGERLSKENPQRNSKKIAFYQCPYCSYKAIQKATLQGHLLCKHTPEDQIIWFQCELCPHKTKRKHHLRDHVLAKHTAPAELEKLKRFKCDKCPYKALGPSRLRRHIHAMHAVPEKIYWLCGLCSYRAKFKHLLRLHVANQHSEPASETPSTQSDWFKCKHCSYKTKQKGNLMRHVMLTLHSKNRKSRRELKLLECDQCSYKTFRNAHLRDHKLLKHTPPEQVNWFKCENCSYKTLRKSDLKRHVMPCRLNTLISSEQNK